MSTPESKTPRTDKAIKLWHDRDETRCLHTIAIGLSRQLETELTTAQQTIRELQQENGRLREALKQIRKYEEGNGFSQRVYVIATQALSATHPSEAKQPEAMVPLALFKAARRLADNLYTDWASAGGVNECKHGYSEGIPCPKCDRFLVDSYAPKQPAKAPCDDGHSIHTTDH